MMKSGVFFTVIALLVSELFKILIYANEMTYDVLPGTESGVMFQKNEYLSQSFPNTTET